MFEPNAYAVYLALFLSLLLLCVGFAVTDFYYTDDGITNRSAALAGLAVCGILTRGFGLARMAAAMEAMATMYGLAIVMLLTSMMLAGTARPFADNVLISIDRALGFDWLALHMALRGDEVFFERASWVYRALHWQPMLLILLLAFSGRISQLWVFVTAWVLAVIITVIIFPFTPAVGGFLYHGITPDDVHGLWITGVWEWYDIMKPVRDGTLRGLGANSVTGIVTFPSFHAAGAVLLAYGFWQFRWLRWPMLVLNIGVFLSSIVVGGHYLIDVIAGGLIAIVAILFSSKILKRTVATSPISSVFQPQPATGRLD